MASTDISLFAYEAAEEKKPKSPNALRTISEASEILDVPQHVLRFWETKFNQIKPLKRNGGRRFYRPQDIDVLQQIKHLLYSQGYTIKGAKKAIDDFLQAHTERPLTSDIWMATVPPASVNDNFTVEPESAVAAALNSAERALDLPAESDEALLADIAQALSSTEEESAPVLTREQMEAMREELVSLRDGLRLLLQDASPVLQ